MKTKEIKGITLISLAVTIVVLLILAGISINTVIGDNGIIKKAQSSAELTKESEAKEIINRTIMEFYLTNEYETLEDFLNTKVLEGRIDKVEKNADGTLKVWKNDYSVTTENKTNFSNNNDNNMNKRIKISTTPYEGIYDSCEHEAITNVNVEPTDTTLEYSTDEINYSTTIPRIINAGTATIKIRASKENYETKNVTVIAKIEKAEGNLSLSETSGTINYPNSTTFTVSGNTGTLSVSSSNTNVATVSISGSTVTVKSAATTNYNEKTATYTVTVKVKDSTFTGNFGVGYYADVDGNGTVDGIIFSDFKYGGSGSWGGTDYTISTVTGLKEYYVSKTNYNGPFGIKDVLSARGSGNARFNVMALSDYNNSATYTFSNAKGITSGEWRVPTYIELATFGGQLGITTSNYSGYGFSNISLKVYPGEILGLAGVIGAGRTEIATTVFGRDKVLGGKAILDGKDVTGLSTKKVLEAGINYVPEDRHLHGLFKISDVAANTTSAMLGDKSMGSFFLNKKEEYRMTQKYVDDFRTKVTGQTQLTGSLSGGNQQKVVFGKSIFLKPEILMLDDPTVGVDVEAKNSICHIIASIADSGSGVLLVSSEFDHLSKVCDRILILKKGVITGSLKRGVDDISESALLTAVQS